VKFSACRILRDDSSMPVMINSFTALALAPAALNTGTPRALIFFTGTLLVPAPARAIAFTLAGISISSIFCERTMIASGSAISALTA